MVENWTVQRFPTKATSWNVCNIEGTVIAHGDKTLYHSNDFGSTWETIHPFLEYGGGAPSIRSLFYINITYLSVRKYMLNMVVFGYLIWRHVN